MVTNGPSKHTIITTRKAGVSKYMDVQTANCQQLSCEERLVYRVLHCSLIGLKTRVWSSDMVVL